jgi:hypothetical protein
MYWKRKHGGLRTLQWTPSKNTTMRERTYLVNGKAPAEGEIFRNPESRQHAREDRQEWTGRLLQGRHRAHHRRLFPPHRRRPALRGLLPPIMASGSSPLSVQLRGYDVYELPARRTARARRSCRCCRS